MRRVSLNEKFGHICKHLANKWVPWEENDCLCNPNLVEEVMAEMEEE